MPAARSPDLTPWTRQPPESAYTTATLRELEAITRAGPYYRGRDTIAGHFAAAADGYARRDGNRGGTRLGQAADTIARQQAGYEAVLAAAPRGHPAVPHLKNVTEQLGGLGTHATELCLTTGPGGPHRYLPRHARDCLVIAAGLARGKAVPGARDSLKAASRAIDQGAPQKALPFLRAAVLQLEQARENGDGPWITRQANRTRNLLGQVQAAYQPRDAAGTVLVPDDTAVTLQPSPAGLHPAGTEGTVSFTHGRLITMTFPGQDGVLFAEARKVRRTGPGQAPRTAAAR
jgi:hypothetical protein